MAALACLLDYVTTDEAIARARLAEDLGYDMVQIGYSADEDPLWTAAACAMGTERVRAATAITPILTRHPAQLAMEAAHVHGRTGGRLVLGIGTSHAAPMRAYLGLTLDHPVGRMREYATILRTLLDRGEVDFQGRHYTARAVLRTEPRWGAKLWFAGLGPKMLDAAAELADGIVMVNVGPAYVREHARPAIDAALERHDRDPASFEVSTWVPTYSGDDEEHARDVYRRITYNYLDAPVYRSLFTAQGRGDLLAIRDDERTPDAIPDDLVDEHCAIGDAAAIAAKIAEYRDAGITIPAIRPLNDDPDDEGIGSTMRAAAGA